MQGILTIYVHDIGPIRLRALAYLRMLLGLSLHDVGHVKELLPLAVAQGFLSDIAKVQKDLETLGCTWKYGP
jgi:hypothetical protein